MTRPLVSVCVGSVRAATLGATLDSILRQTYQEWEVIVVGQGDDPHLQRVADEIQERDSRIHYVHAQQLGLSRARNNAVAEARGAIIAMTDDDCEAREDWLETIVECFSDKQSLMLVGGMLSKPARPSRLFAMCPAFKPAEAIYTAGLGVEPPPGWDWIGANFAFRRRLYELTGPFDEQLGAGATFPAAEDTDFKLRVEKLGLPMLSTPRSVVIHSNGYRSGLRTILRSSLNYATGNGGMAGKLTLQGDPRGEMWLETTRKQCTSLTLRTLRPHRLPNNMMRLRHFREAYARCVREFEVDSRTNTLRPKAALLDAKPW